MGTDTATYSISFTQKLMTEEGSFIIPEKNDTGLMFADPYLRVFPRKVTLAPNQPQVIRLQFIKKADMADGEYRSHLYFRSEKNYQPKGMNQKLDSNLMAVSITPIFGISIAVIIRVGKLSANASLSDFKVEPSADSIPVLKFVVHREGNMSLYGDFLVTYQPDEGPAVDIGIMNGVGVYTNIKKRNISIRLLRAQGMKLKKGKIKVTYTSRQGKDQSILTSADIVL
jgi:hypothetical protein